MKRAFTLIELLVVIAIIAILAAILFPVFSQAKEAAKKTASVSNQKQIGTSLKLYMVDHDDVFPRNDDCVQGSSLNPRINQTGPLSGDGCSGGGPYPFRMNHYSWQKWPLPYMKNVQIFESPNRQKLDTSHLGGWRQWTDNGQIMGAYALNLALTGAVNTWARSATAAGRLRNSWLGGTETSVPNPAEAWLLNELVNPLIDFSPVWVDAINDPLATQTVYPMAIREFWAANYMRATGTCVYGNTPDPRLTTNGTIVVGFVDTHVKAVPVGQFLAKTPTAAEINAVLDANTQCGISSGTYRPGNTPNLNVNYPMWGLGQ